MTSKNQTEFIRLGSVPSGRRAARGTQLREFCWFFGKTYREKVPRSTQLRGFCWCFVRKTKRRKSRPRRKSRRHHRPCQAALSIVVSVTSTITGYRPPATHHPPTYHPPHTTHHLHTTHLLMPEHTTVCACRLPNTPGHLPQCSCCALGCSSSRSAPIQRPRLQPPLQHRRRRRRAAAPIIAATAAETPRQQLPPHRASRPQSCAGSQQWA